ncbi:flagellar basal body-associated protein FliL [Vibrio sp. HA2012]|uniref:flagellar basal body-associated protein FliL n=1 Tax=Vibrio sp. HA2012 TaxID=1971595 RepID=UPI000C2CD940|nr:flagellar basal body-associated protein FliL [Vibrio sp. HA2012]PJC84999.1 flagellar basal body-associated protein FliL [Vibrio sp. HA2012]
MLTRYLTLFLCMTSLVFSSRILAEDTPAELAGPQFAYFTLAPDLTTNFYTKGKKLGYLQVRIDLMVADATYISALEKHQPLIRDAIIEKIGEQPEDKIKNLAGREELRKELMEYLNDILLAETGRTLLTDLLFTKYLYQ